MDGLMEIGLTINYLLAESDIVLFLRKKKKKKSEFVLLFFLQAQLLWWSTSSFWPFTSSLLLHILADLPAKKIPS